LPVRVAGLGVARALETNMNGKSGRLRGQSVPGWAPGLYPGMTDRRAVSVRRENNRRIVLVVDDEPLIRWALSEAMSEAGFAVRAAGSALEARGQISVGARPADEVFVDLRLPDAVDLELLKTLKARAPASGVILMTADGTPDGEREMRHAGADRFVRKPFDLHEMVRLAATPCFSACRAGGNLGDRSQRSSVPTHAPVPSACLRRRAASPHHAIRHRNYDHE
jgi:CheY-like chemotaxis protein